MRQTRRIGGHGVQRYALLGALALGAVGGIARADGPPAPAPAANPPDLPPPGRATRDTVEFLADGLVSGDGLRREVARGALAGASAERARAVALELARRLVPSSPVIRHATSNVGVESEFRYFDLSQSAAGALPGYDPRATQTVTRILSAEEAEVWTKAAARTSGVRLLTAPRITTYDGQRANVQVTNQMAYIADFDIQRTANGTIADPVIRNVIDGVNTQVRATASADRAYLSLEIDLDLRRLGSPIAEDRLKVAGIDAPLVVQRPEINGIRWTRTVMVPSGGTVLVMLPPGFGFDAAHRDHGLSLMVTSRVTTLDVVPGTPVMDFGGEDVFRSEPPPPPGPKPATPAPVPAPMPVPVPTK